MKIEKEEIPSFGKAYGMLRRSFIVINSSLCVEYINDFGLKTLGLNKKNLVIGQSLINIWKEIKLPEIIDVNGKMVNKRYVVTLKGHSRQWEKILVTVAHEPWFFLVDEDVTEKENVYRILEAECMNTTGHVFNKSISVDQYINEMHNYLTSIINKIPCIVFWKNKHLKYIGCNQMAADFLHFNSTDEIVGKTDFDLFPDRDLAKSYRAIDREIFSDGKAILNEPGQLVNASGELFFTLVSKVPIKNQAGEVVGIVGITIDVTKEKQAEIAKTEFISNMEHDLKTPFSGIGGIANLLHGSETDPSKKEFLGLMVASCAQWENVHHRIFDSLIAEDPTAVTIKTVSIYHELMEIKEMMSATLFLKKLDFIIDPILDEYDSLETDQFKFRLIISSLIGNAINFTEQGCVRITVGHDNNTCFVRVGDTGIGIPPDKLDYIFEKFTKLSKSNTHGGNFKGVGLGLYTSRQYATQLGGAIEVASTLGNGATFTLRLPLNK